MIDISLAVRTTIIGLLYSCNILHLKQQQAKDVSNAVLILLCCSLKIESLRSFRKKMCGAPTLKPSGKRTLPEPSSWLPPRITEPGSATGDCDPVFQIKVRKGLLVKFCTLSFYISAPIYCPREIMVSLKFKLKHRNVNLLENDYAVVPH